MRILIGLVAALCLAAAAPQARAQDAVSRIQSAGVLKVGMAPSPPWQAPNPATGEYEGITVDIAKQIATVMKVRLQIVDATWATLMAGLGGGQYDIAMGNIYATPERALAVAFTQPYLNDGMYVLAKKDSHVQSMEDLNKPETIFAGLAGTVESKYPATMFPKAQIRELVSENAAAPTLEVISGRANVRLMPPSAYLFASAQNPAVLQNTRLINDMNSLMRPIGMSFAVNPKEMHLLNFLNVFIQERTMNGEIVKLRDSWYDRFGKAAAPK